MERKPVTSNNISAIGYDPETNRLEVEFSSSSVYSYQNVPPEKHAAFMNAGSIGKHFHTHIKGNHEFEKVQSE